MAVVRELDEATGGVPKVLGPKGGDVNRPQYRPEARRAPLNTNNGTTLHKFEHKDTATNGLSNEQPWHLMAAYMLLAGRTNSEIAMAAGVGPNHVSMLRAQRFFQERLALLANEAGGEIIGLLQSEAQASLQKLVDLRDGAESERVQLAAASTLFDHANGKAVQRVITHASRSVYASPADEMAALQSELETLRQRNKPAITASQDQTTIETK